LHWQSIASPRSLRKTHFLCDLCGKELNSHTIGLCEQQNCDSCDGEQGSGYRLPADLFVEGKITDRQKYHRRKRHQRASSPNFGKTFLSHPYIILHKNSVEESLTLLSLFCFWF